MFKPSLIALSLTAALCSTALAEGPKIHSGSKAGSYFGAFCPQAKEAVGKAYFEHTCAISGGTVDNVNKVLTNPTDVGLGQWDVMAQLPQEQLDQLQIVDSGLGLECMYAVTSDASITSLSDISDRIPMSIPSADSGSAASFAFLQTLGAGLGDLRNITNKDTPMAAIESVISGDSVMAFFVQFADTSNAVFKTINDAGLTFVPVINREILSQEVAGIKLYEPSEVKVVKQGFFAKAANAVGQGNPPPTIATTCTKIVTFTGKPKDSDGEALVEHLQKVERPTSDGWGDIFGNVKALGAETLAKYTQ